MPFTEEHANQLRHILNDMANKMDETFPLEAAMLRRAASKSSHDVVECVRQVKAELSYYDERMRELGEPTT